MKKTLKGKLIFEKVDPLIVTFRMETNRPEAFHSDLKVRLKREFFPDDLEGREITGTFKHTIEIK